MLNDAGGISNLLLVLIFLEEILGEIVYEWNELYVKDGGKYRSWRPTSFEFSDDKFYVTLADVNKDSPGVGVVAWFAREYGANPTLAVYGDRNDYRIYSETGAVLAPMLVRTDPCGDTWVVDANIYNISGSQVKKTPVVHIYDGKTKEKKRIHHFQDNMWQRESLFMNLVFLVRESVVPRDPNRCAALTAYLVDLNGFQLFAYHYHEDASTRYYRYNDPYVLLPDGHVQHKSNPNITGIYGLALAKTEKYGPLLFFHSLAGTVEFVIPVEKLSHESALNYGDIRTSYDKGELSEAGRTAFDPETETFFFAELKTRKIGCLNLHTILNKEMSLPTYGRYDVDLKDGAIMDLKIIAGELWMLTHSPWKTTLRKESLSRIIWKAQCTIKFRDQNCDSFNCQRSEEQTRNASSMIDLNFCKLLITAAIIKIILTF